MKKMIKALLPIALLAGLLSACGGKTGGSQTSQSTSAQDSSSSSISIDESLTITVNFYRDYNYTHYRARYYQTTVKNGSLITDVPANPEAPLPEFPVFKGWSTKEVTDDYEHDIWNFQTDRVMLVNADTINFYGIWAAE